jgi:hypothetical protein
VADLVSLEPDLSFHAAGKFFANEALHIVDGLLQVFDGAEVREHGFHNGPDVFSAADAAGPMTATEVHNLVAIYYWRDDQGNEYFSPLSRVVSFTIVTGGIALTNIPNYRLTDKTNVKILIYRTLNNGTVYYLAGSLDNDPDSGAQSLTLTAADGSINANPTLYTSGTPSVLENSVPPSPHHAWTDGLTAYLIPADDRQSLWVSKPISARLGVEWSDNLVVRLPSDDLLVGGAILDGRQVVFKERSIRYLVGSRPNALGQGGYSDSRRITTDVGCKNNRSIVGFPDGILFKSHKGIYALNRNLQAQYIGAPVEAFNNDTVLNAILVEDLNEVRFLLDSGTVLVYDYFHKAWSTFTNHAGVDAAIWKGAYTWANRSGNVFHSLRDDLFTDDGKEYTLRCRTPWIKVAGLTGYQRTKRIGILAEYRSKNVATQEASWDSEGIQKTVGGPYMARLHVKKQKATAIMVELEVASKGEGLRLSGLSLRLAGKHGLFKPNKAKDQ